MSDATYIVLRRPFDDDPDRDEEPRWEKVGFAPSLAAAKRLAMRPVTDDGEAVDVGPGDLLLAMPLDSFNLLLFAEAAKHLFVVRGEGVVVPAPPTVGLVGRKTWIQGWESEGFGTVMISLAAPLGKVNVVLLMCAALRAAAVRLPTQGWRQRDVLRAINVAEGVARKSEATYTLRYAVTGARQAGLSGGKIYSATTAKDAATAAYQASYALSHAANFVGTSIGVRDEDIICEMGSIIRQYVPLGTILRLRLGDGSPPDLSAVIPRA
jgi:hypothetical protein